MAKKLKEVAKPAAKKVTKKVATKTTKATAKPVTKKISAKTTKPVAKKTTSKGTTVEKEMAKITKLVEKAKKDGKKSVVVFTTKDSHHNGLANGRVSFEDLKDVYRDLYLELVCTYRGTIKTNPINLFKREIEWSVNF
jgi:hypothetical protein